MPPLPLLDLAAIDLEKVVYDHEFIYSRLPQCFEFELLDAVCHFDRPNRVAVAYVDCRPDAWWTRGHIPGRPILPGVLQIEAAAQLTAFLARYVDGCEFFIALGGVDQARFREAVLPPSRLYIVCKLTEDRSRRVTSSVQGIVNNQIVFEAIIAGLAMRG
jgi:3-hydroxyacyl-[acyl-carrier-protein] dehydratase